MDLRRNTPLLALCSLALAAGAIAPAPCQAYINPRFTPLHLVAESNTILVGELAAAAEGAGSWKFKIAEALKGAKAAEITFTLGKLKEEDSATVATALKASGPHAALWFQSTEGEQQLAYLAVGGQYLELRPAAAGAWQVSAPATKLTGVFAGGTDTLVRMVRYILADPEADVPVAVGVSWLREAPVLGKVEGNVACLSAVPLGRPARMHLFAASDRGDRLWRAKENDEAFEDVTAAAGLVTGSRQAVWTDLVGRGELQLVTWNGQRVTAWQWSDGKLSPLGKAGAGGGFTLKNCLGLAPCRRFDGSPAVIASTRDGPVLLRLDQDRAWASEPLPAPGKELDLGEAACACIVADLDGDGCFDVLQPRTKGGLLWRGRAGGFAPPVRSAVAIDGPARAAVGDFDGDGALDVFLSGPKTSELWANDGHASFAPTLAGCGSLSYKSTAGASCCLSADLNHDGRADLVVLFAGGELAYHFNRGFRCFGEEGELRLNSPPDVPAGTGQVACAVADFNGDGSLDLAVAFADGTVTCHYNDALRKPVLRVRRGGALAGDASAGVAAASGTESAPATAKAVATTATAPATRTEKTGAAALSRDAASAPAPARGPLQFSVWQGEDAAGAGAKSASCLGVFLLDGPETLVSLRDLRECVIRYTLPLRGELVQKVKLPRKPPEGGVTVTLEVP